MGGTNGEETRLQPVMIADHRALDFLNTVLRVECELVDTLQSDEDVLAWLARADWPVDGSRMRRGALLQSARRLRDVVRDLIERRKAGRRVDPTALNGFLEAAHSHLKLEAKRDGRRLELSREWRLDSTERMLAPLAEAAAELLAQADFELVKHCEGPECVLWFYDRTKSHHRRWCSMAMCGNRNKVAAFRERHRAV